MTVCYRTDKPLTRQHASGPYNHAAAHEKSPLLSAGFCGEAGIRTLGPSKGSTVFETAPFDHSGTSPIFQHVAVVLSVERICKDTSFFPFTQLFFRTQHVFLPPNTPLPLRHQKKTSPANDCNNEPYEPAKSIRHPCPRTSAARRPTARDHDKTPRRKALPFHSPRLSAHPTNPKNSPCRNNTSARATRRTAEIGNAAFKRLKGLLWKAVMLNLFQHLIPEVKGLKGY